jgi:hypothetical protein
VPWTSKWGQTRVRHGVPAWAASLLSSHDHGSGGASRPCSACLYLLASLDSIARSMSTSRFASTRRTRSTAISTHTPNPCGWCFASSWRMSSAPASPMSSWGSSTASVGAAVIVAFVLESVIGRLRPDQADSALTFTPLRAFTRFHNREVCFPSGEATMAFAMAYGLSRLVPRFAGLFYTLATLASIARLVNGSHYLGDVAAGALLGLLCGRVVYGYLSTSGPPSLRASQCP